MMMMTTMMMTTTMMITTTTMMMMMMTRHVVWRLTVQAIERNCLAFHSIETSTKPQFDKRVFPADLFCIEKLMKDCIEEILIRRNATFLSNDVE